jgi:phosphoserine aminotransferase
VIGQVFKWLLRQGGLEAIARHNEEKARIIYDAIDNSGGFYRGVARRDSRSRMNVTFKTPSESLDQRFVEEAERQAMSGLKGHRSAGGIRASIYNAFPREGCVALAAFMKEFASRNG